MLIGSCAHCSYMRSEGEKNLELLEICILFCIFSFNLSHFVQNYGKEKKERQENGRSKQPVRKHNL